MIELDNPELLERCLQRSAGSWEEFVRRFSDLIYSTIRRHRLSHDEARDAFQATLITVSETLGRLRDPNHVVSWLVTISSRQAINQVRLRQRETPSDIDDRVLAESRMPADPEPTADLQLEALERAHQAQVGLDLLSERCRGLLRGLYVDDLPYETVAAEQEIALGSVGPLRARCLDRLRRIFEERGFLR